MFVVRVYEETGPWVVGHKDMFLEVKQDIQGLALHVYFTPRVEYFSP